MAMPTSNNNETSPPPAITPVKRLSAMLSVDSVKERFQGALKEHSDLFLTSILDIYSSDTNLQKCDPGKVITECLKAATLRLPLNKQLGFAYIVPFDKSTKSVVGGKDTWTKESIPTFVIGYKGLIQLAMRTGSYLTINADAIYEGELKDTDKLTGIIDLSGKRSGDKVVGYFAHFETINGFKKTMFMATDDMEKYAKKYSKSYSSSSSPWKSDFDSMAMKTMLRRLLGKYGIMSVEFAAGVSKDNDERDPSEELPFEANAGDFIDMEPIEPKAEPIAESPAESGQEKPDF